MAGAAMLVVVGLLLARARADLGVMTDITLGFGQALDHCREESGLTQEKMEEFFHFWSEDFKLEARELGCALRCMSAHFNLITDVNSMHHANAEKFVKSFPNGEVLAEQLIGFLHECERQHHAEADACFRVLHMAACFRNACRGARLAPTMEMLLAEFIMQAET
uniref:General odorant binding protein 1 n=1 Tax=Ostrinia latipennis TaxID=99578 RepID=A0A2Z5V699_9NEOP|nr:general odorant binding protein 1 [Ostrinia latipennis]